MARKKPGPYAPLSAHYADDDRIMAAGEEAELLYLRALAYCARTPKTEGHLTFAQVKTRLGLDGAEERAETCAEVGLLERTDSGYRITSWLKWNLSAEEVERVRTQDRNRKGTHPTSTDTGNGSGKRSGNQGGKPTGIPVPYTETDTDTETGSMPRKRGTRIPQPWIVDESMREWALAEGMDPTWVVKHTQRFENHWLAKTGRDATKLDWRATWKNWLLREADSNPPRTNGTADEHHERYMQRLAAAERNQT